MLFPMLFPLSREVFWVFFYTFLSYFESSEYSGRISLRGELVLHLAAIASA